MRRLHTLSHDGNVGFIEPARNQLVGGISAQEPVENLVGLRVADSKVALVGLTHHKVGGWRLPNNYVGNAEVTRECPDLRLEQIAERVDGWRVVGVPGEIAEQPLGLVPRSERNAAVLRGEIEQRDHAHSRHDVSSASTLRIRLVAEISVDTG